jgi:RimJ/RimL family protein N-acetyltransferase
MEIIGERIQLRDFTDSDRTFFGELEGHELTTRFENHRPDAAQIQKDFAAAISHAQCKPREHFNLIICRTADNIPLGGVSLKLNWSEIREWEIGWALHPDYWRQGYAAEAVRLMTGYAFESLNAHRIVAYANVDNLRSENLMIRVGMIKDGLLRETRYCNQVWCDELVYSMLERDWVQLNI